MLVSLRRHAPTAGNLANRYVGRTDQPLAPEGRVLAGRLTPDSSVVRVHTSTLRRTIETAEILYPAAAILPCSGLAEMDFGVFEGKSHEELAADPGYLAWIGSNCETPCPGGERKDAFAGRSRRSFSAIVAQERDAGAEAVHFVLHGGVIMAVMSGLVGAERDFYRWRAGYCGGFVVAEGRSGWRLERTLAAFPQNADPFFARSGMENMIPETRPEAVRFRKRTDEGGA